MTCPDRRASTDGAGAAYDYAHHQDTLAENFPTMRSDEETHGENGVRGREVLCCPTLACIEEPVMPWHGTIMLPRCWPSGVRRVV